MITRSITVSVSIQCPPATVYDFVVNPENLPRWATAFCKSARRINGEWFIETPDGPIKIRFADANPHGVLDHTLTISPDVEVYVPMRVFANVDGSEAVLTLFKQPSMSDERLNIDRGMVERDLQTLKRVLET